MGALVFLAIFLTLELLAKSAYRFYWSNRRDKTAAWAVKQTSIYPRLTWKHVKGYEHLPDVPDVRET